MIIVLGSQQPIIDLTRAESKQPWTHANPILRGYRTIVEQDIFNRKNNKTEEEKGGVRSPKKFNKRFNILIVKFVFISWTSAIYFRIWAFCHKHNFSIV